MDSGALTRRPKVHDEPAVIQPLGDNFGVCEFDNLDFDLTHGHRSSEYPMETHGRADATLPAHGATKHDSPAYPPADERLSLNGCLSFLSSALKSARAKSADAIVPSVCGVKNSRFLEKMQAQMGVRASTRDRPFPTAPMSANAGYAFRP